MSVGADDLWRVRVAGEDEKVLTLEQVDDLFRLGVIDENTLLWQEGMDEWLPLKVVAGLDDDEEQAAPAAALAPPPSGLPPPSQLPPPPPPPSPLPPPPRSQMPPAGASPSLVAPPPVHRATLMPGWTSAPASVSPVRSAPPPPSARPTPPPPSVRSAPPPPAIGSAPPPPPSARPALAPIGSAPPPPPPPRPNLAPSVPPPSVAPALPFTPPVVVAPPLQQSARGSGLETALIALIALSGLVVTLHRNGALQAMLSSVGAGSVATSLESALGGPGFGTPRAVEVLVGKPQR